MCLFPRRLRINGVLRDIPCGSCLECRRQFRHSLEYRLYNELMHHSNARFVTLTFREDTVPTGIVESTGELLRVCDYSVFQKFNKLFRIRCKRSGISLDNTSWLCTSEYGSKTYRPHFHCILVGYSHKALSLFCSLWRELYGFTQIKRIKMEFSDICKVSKYVGKYVCKQSDNLYFDDWYKIYTREFDLPRTCLRKSLRFGRCVDMRKLFYDVFPMKPVFRSMYPISVAGQCMPWYTHDYYLKDFYGIKVPLGSRLISLPKSFRHYFFICNYDLIFKYFSKVNLSLDNMGEQNFYSFLAQSVDVNLRLRLSASEKAQLPSSSTSSSVLFEQAPVEIRLSRLYKSERRKFKDFD